MDVNVGTSFDRVHKLLEEMKDLPLEKLSGRVQELQDDIEALFKKIEYLHSLSEEFRQVDLSEDVYYLFRLLAQKEPRKVSHRFPLLSRAAGVFTL